MNTFEQTVKPEPETRLSNITEGTMVQNFVNQLKKEQDAIRVSGEVRLSKFKAENSAEFGG